MLEAKKVSKLISDLIALWLKWMKLNSITLDLSVSFDERYKTMMAQEELINKRYKIIEEIDNVIDVIEKSTKQIKITSNKEN